MASTDYSDLSARILDGEALRIGFLYWPRPEPPLLIERARLVASAMPPGTIAAGVSAGWVWTGLGLPTPLSLIAGRSPAPSPLARHEWKIRGVKLCPTDTTLLGTLTLLTPDATAGDLWTCEAADTVAAAQLFGMASELPEHTQGRALRRQALVESWRAHYPWATRYTS
jgi:hypothetical protein